MISDLTIRLTAPLLGETLSHQGLACHETVELVYWRNRLFTLHDSLYSHNLDYIRIV